MASAKCCALNYSKWKAYATKEAKGKDTSTFDYGCGRPVKDYEFGTCENAEHKNQLATYCPIAGGKYGEIARQANDDDNPIHPIIANEQRKKVLFVLGKNIMATTAQQIDGEMETVLQLEAMHLPSNMEYDYGDEPVYEGATE